MLEVTAYKCRCGTIYENPCDIRQCRECGREICDDCAGFQSDLCWHCNDRFIYDERE